MRLQHFLALLCLLTAPLLSNAQTNDPQFKRGVDLFNAKRYDQAVFILEPYADQGVEIALKFVSQAYMFGYGVPIDKQKALDQLRRAASIEKDGWANYLLANFHLKGSSGATQDDVKGLAYMERANQLGHKDAYQFLSEVFPGQYQLGDAPKTVSSSEVTHSNYEKTHAAESQNSVENLPKHESRAEVTSLTGLSLSEIQKKHGGKIEISKLEYKKNYNRLGKDLIATKCLDVSIPHQLHISCQGDKAINFNAFGFQLASAFRSRPKTGESLNI